MKTRIKKQPVRRSSFALAATAILVLILGTPPANAEEVPREYIYGAELMTPNERDAYRQGLQQAPTDEARGQYRLGRRIGRGRFRGRRRIRLRSVDIGPCTGPYGGARAFQRSVVEGGEGADRRSRAPGGGGVLGHDSVL